jgi:hypothetical protein
LQFMVDIIIFGIARNVSDWLIVHTQLPPLIHYYFILFESVLLSEGVFYFSS